MHAMRTALRAGLEEAGFRVSDEDAAMVAARHLRRPSVYVRARLLDDASWELWAVGETGAYPLYPQSVGELVHLLNESYGADAQARRG